MRVSGVTPGIHAEVTANDTTLGWGLANEAGIATVTNALWSLGSFTVKARENGVGPVFAAPIEVVSRTPVTISGQAFAVTAPGQVRIGETFNVVVTGAPAGVHTEVTANDVTLGWPLADTNGRATAINALWTSGLFTITARINGVGAAVTTQIRVGDTTTASTTPGSTTPPSTVVPPSLPASSLPPSIPPTSRPTNGQITIAIETGGRPGPFAGQTYIVTPSAPNRSLGDFEVECEGLQSTAAGYVCENTRTTINTIIVRDKQGEYRPQTTQWWTTSSQAINLPAGERAIIDLPKIYGLEASEFWNVVLKGGTCVEAICTLTSPSFYTRPQFPSRSGPYPADDLAQVQFDALGAKGQATFPIFVSTRDFEVPTQATQGQTVTLRVPAAAKPGTWFAFEIGKTLLGRDWSGGTTLGWVQTDAEGTATLTTQVWDVGPQVAITARNQSTGFIYSAYIEVTPL